METPHTSRNEVLRVTKCQSIEAIEELFTANCASTSALDISIPTNTRDVQCGATGSFIQFLITWAKHHPTSNLVMHSTNPDMLQTHITNLSNTQHGLVALLVSPHIVSADGRIDLTVPARDIAMQMIKKMTLSALGQVSGPELMLLSADATTFRYPPQLYFPTSSIYGKVLPRKEFVALAEMMMDRLTSIYRRNAPLSNTLKDSLGTILFELFKNTDMWAQRELDNSFIVRSVRGLRLELTSRMTLRTEAIATPHADYVARLDRELGGPDLLEVSIFDSGPGLAARAYNRYPDKQMSLIDEYSGIMQCLQLHYTSTNKSHHGIGLIEVMRALTLARAFLRIRTGRLALYRDFVLSPLTSDDDLHLNDWSSHDRSLRDFGRAEGLLLSILLPVPSEESAI